MLVNPQFKIDLEDLVAAEEWEAVRAFFSHWDSEEELIDKIFLFCHFFLDHYSGRFSCLGNRFSHSETGPF